MVGRSDAEQHADNLGRVCAGKVEVEGLKVGLIVNLAHQLVGLHHGCQRLHAGNSQRQIGAAMGHHHLDVIIAGQYIATNHVRHGACGLREIFLHSEWCLLHHLLVHGFRAMRMQNHHSLSFVQHREERVEFWRAQILSVNIRCQFDSVGFQHIEGIFRLLNSF